MFKSPNYKVHHLHKNLAYIQLILAQLCIGINITTGKFLSTSLNLYVMLEIRFAIGSMILALYMIAKKGRNFTFEAFTIKETIIIFIQSLCGGFLFNYFLIKGLNHTDATYAGAITSLVPFMVVLLSVMFLKDKLSKYQTLAIILSAIGTYILCYKNDFNQNIEWYGIIMLFTSVLPEALFVVLGKFISSKLSPLGMALTVNIINMIAFIPFVLYIDIYRDVLLITENSKVFWSLVVYGLSGGAFFFLFWYEGLSKVQASTAGLFTCLMPVFTIILAMLFLHEITEAKEWIGISIIISSLIIMAKSERG
jgi:drug/metabolite transporter (DMT)-like permease